MSKVSINNPLTLIAIFAGMAEVAAVSVLPFLELTIQTIFVWFVMLFPILLVSFFFAVLWWKSQNLYAPTDYREDASYLHVQGTRRPAGSLIHTDEREHEGPDSGSRVTASPTPTPAPTSTPAAEVVVGGEPTSATDLGHSSTKQSFYRLHSPAPTPRIAQTTLEAGEAVMAERLALEKLRSQHGGELTSPATVTMDDVPYQFDGVLVKGRAITIVEVIYKRGRDISSRVKNQLGIFRKLKNQMESSGERHDVRFTIALVTGETEDPQSLDSLVRGYADNFALDVSVEVFKLEALMSELNS